MLALIMPDLGPG